MKTKANSIGGSGNLENQPAKSDEKVLKGIQTRLPVFKVPAHAEMIPGDRARQILEEM